MRVELTAAEIVELHDLTVFVLRRGGEQVNPALTSAMRKLKKAGVSLRCVHCRERMTRRRDRICDACNVYRHQYGKLPPPVTLSKRWSA